MSADLLASADERNLATDNSSMTNPWLDLSGKLPADIETVLQDVAQIVAAQ